MGQGRTTESDSILSETENCSAIGKTDIEFTRTKRDIKRHKCTYDGCVAIFNRPSRLARHIRFHTGERSYKCNHPGCDKAYTNSSHLKRHTETHSIQKKTYQCPECPLSISNRHNLKRHYNAMHGDRSKLTCKECNETFAKKYQLATHMSIHTGQLYNCDQCNKSFTNMNKFKRHKTSHEEGKKVYPCTAPGCGQVFGKWLLLCAHAKTHVFNCKFKDCDKVFTNKYRLRIHSKVHLENRTVVPCPYDGCNRSYYLKSNLDLHVRIKHLGQRYECDVCKVLLSSKARVADHIHKIHMSERRIKRAKILQRKRRKDIGTRKRSAVSALVGVNLPPKIERMILKREEDITYLEQFNGALDDNPNS